MVSSFQEIIDEVRKSKQITISVAAAQDEEVLLCVKAALEQGIAQSILVGDEALIRPLVTKLDLPETIRIIHEPDLRKAALTAVSLVRSGEAQVLLKGLLNTSDYLKAVLNPEVGLRKGRLLSHLAAYEVPGSMKLVFSTDTGINIAPNLEEKIAILDNALEAMKVIGIDSPNVAVMAANELVNPKMQGTVDAKALLDKYTADSSFTGIIEGPIAMDVAASPEAAKHKGIDSKISGDVDLFMMPDLEAGNIWSKALIFYAHFKMAGVILGATNPIVLVSRADNAETKLNSIALACFVAAGEKSLTQAAAK